MVERKKPKRKTTICKAQDRKQYIDQNETTKNRGWTYPWYFVTQMFRKRGGDR